MYPVSVTYISAAVAGVLAAAALAIWPWARQRGRATGFDVDAPVIGLSWEDVGSGVVALFITVLVLGLVTERREAAVRVVGAALIAGVVAMVLDLFV